MADTVYELVAKISVDSSGVDQGLSDTKSKIENSGVTDATQDVEQRIARSSYLASAAVVAGGAAIAKGIYSAGRALVGFATDSAAYADNLITMSTVTGLSTEALQEYTYMAELVDVSVETITGSMAKLTKSMASARDGGEKQMAAFEKLGVQVTDSEGRLRDNNDVFLDVIEALNGMEEGAERDAIIMEIFGRSAQQLNPLIAQGRKGIERFAAEARELGFVLDDETLASLGALDDTMQRLQGVKMNIRNQLGIAMAPALERILDKLLEVSAKIDWASIGEKLGNALETGADKLIGFIENVDIDKLISGASTLMEGLINGISWILEHSEEIMKLIRDIGIGLVAGKGFNILSGLFGGGGSGGSGGLSILSKVFSGGAKAVGTTGATGAAGATGGASALGGFLSSGWGALALPFMEVLGLGKGAWDYFSTRREMMAGATLGDGATIEEMRANVERLTGVYEEAKAFYDSRQGELYGDMPDGQWLLSQATAEYDAARDALNAAQAELDAALATTSDSAASAGDEVSTEMTALSGEASAWGSDMMTNFASGIIAGANGSVLPAVLSVATGIAALLHHSEPDKGPLAHDSEWMPDMMAGFAKGIRDNRGMVLGELDSLAADMSTSMSAPAPSVSGFGGGVGGNVINFAPSIHIDGDITDPRKKAEELMVYMREIFIREAYA